MLKYSITRQTIASSNILSCSSVAPATAKNPQGRPTMHNLRVTITAEASGTPIDTIISTKDYATELLRLAETHGLAVTHHSDTVKAEGRFLKDGNSVGSWTKLVPPTTAETVKALSALSQAFATAWKNRNAVDGATSADARDTVTIVREGTPPAQALALVGFPLG